MSTCHNRQSYATEILDQVLCHRITILLCSLNSSMYLMSGLYFTITISVLYIGNFCEPTRLQVQPFPIRFTFQIEVDTVVEIVICQHLPGKQENSREVARKEVIQPLRVKKQQHFLTNSKSRKLLVHMGA